MRKYSGAYAPIEAGLVIVSGMYAPAVLFAAVTAVTAPCTAVGALMPKRLAATTRYAKFVVTAGSVPLPWSPVVPVAAPATMLAGVEGVRVDVAAARGATALVMNRHGLKVTGPDIVVIASND